MKTEKPILFSTPMVQAIIEVNENEAPEGFYAVAKNEAPTPNVCDSCDARKLCQENEDGWCQKNRCMAYEAVSTKDGKTYKRQDGCSVFFKRVT